MYYPIFSIALGALLLVLGVCDVCKRKITWGYSSRMKPKEREIWQRWVGVLELILAVCEFSYVFLPKDAARHFVPSSPFWCFLRSVSLGLTTTGSMSTRMTRIINETSHR